MVYTIRPPFFYRLLYNDALFRVKDAKNEMYLTFDDGPTPDVTDWVLDELKKHNAKATFFCLGKNVKAYPGLFARIKAEGHSIGNHTFNHTNGWKAGIKDYIKDVEKCANEGFEASLFRPPYGKIKPSQFKAVNKDYKVVFWDVLAGDFDLSKSPEHCLNNVLNNTRDGSIIVLHDSVKAAPTLKTILPRILDELKEYTFSKIE